MNLDKNKIRADALEKIDYRSSAHHAIDATIDACAAQYNPVIADLQAQVEALNVKAARWEKCKTMSKQWWINAMEEAGLKGGRSLDEQIDAAISKGGE